MALASNIHAEVIFKDKKGETAFTENGRLVLYVEQGNGSTFTAVLAYHEVKNGTLWRFLRLVQGNVKGNSLDFHSADSDLFFFTGAWKRDYLELSYNKNNGAEATAKMKLGVPVDFGKGHLLLWSDLSLTAGGQDADTLC